MLSLNIDSDLTCLFDSVFFVSFNVSEDGRFCGKNARTEMLQGGENLDQKWFIDHSGALARK